MTARVGLIGRRFLLFVTQAVNVPWVTRPLTHPPTQSLRVDLHTPYSRAAFICSADLVLHSILSFPHIAYTIAGVHSPVFYHQYAHPSRLCRCPLQQCNYLL